MSHESPLSDRRHHSMQTELLSLEELQNITAGESHARIPQRVAPPWLNLELEIVFFSVNPPMRDGTAYGLVQ
jgi:hypothetical protein